MCIRDRYADELEKLQSVPVDNLRESMLLDDLHAIFVKQEYDKLQHMIDFYKLL